MAAIDIGLEAIDRANVANVSTSTLVDNVNPANGTGVITEVDIWFAGGPANDTWVGTFSAAGDTLTCHDSESVGNVSIGSKQTFSGLDIAVNIGEYLGVNERITATCDLEAGPDNGLWFKAGEFIDPADSGGFTLLTGFGVSLFGTGATVSGWSGGNVLGVSPGNIDKINGVEIGNIVKVSGVT